MPKSVKRIEFDAFRLFKEYNVLLSGHGKNIDKCLNVKFLVHHESYSHRYAEECGIKFEIIEK